MTRLDYASTTVGWSKRAIWCFVLPFIGVALPSACFALANRLPLNRVGSVVVVCLALATMPSFAIASIVSGVRALRETRGGAARGRRLAIAGLVLASLALLYGVWCAIMVGMLASMKPINP